MVIKLGC